MQVQLSSDLQRLVTRLPATFLPRGLRMGVLQESLKSLLLKVAIRRQRLREVPLPHQDKADRFTQGVCLVLPRQQECYRMTMERLVHPDRFDIRIVQEVHHKGERGHTGQMPGMSQGHKLGQHIAVRQSNTSRVVEGTRVGMERLCSVVKTQEPEVSRTYNKYPNGRVI